MLGGQYSVENPHSLQIFGRQQGKIRMWRKIENTKRRDSMLAYEVPGYLIREAQPASLPNATIAKRMRLTIACLCASCGALVLSGYDTIQIMDHRMRSKDA
jgi:hypothetical protein